jgi:hypothetical protein
MNVIFTLYGRSQTFERYHIFKEFISQLFIIFPPSFWWRDIYVYVSCVYFDQRFPKF